MAFRIRNVMLFFVLEFLFGTNFAQAQVVKTSGADFLKIRTGARQLALGGSFTGLANDANTIFWNPAGLSTLSGWQANLMQNNWLADLQLESISLVLPEYWDSMRIGLFGFQLWSPSWDNTNGKLAAESYRDLLLGIGFGREIYPGLHVGLTGKLIQRNLSEFTATGMAVDVGLLYASVHHWSIGVSAENLGPTLNLNGTKTSLPTLLIAGGAYSLEKYSWLHPTFLADVRYDVVGENLIPSAGVEVWFKDWLALRGGLMFNQSVTTFTFGLGIHWNFINFDYAFLPYKNSMTSFSNPLSSFQTAINVQSLLPRPFHILYPGLDKKKISDEIVRLKQKKLFRKKSNNIREIQELLKQIHPEWKSGKIQKELANLILFVDQGDSINFMWKRSLASIPSHKLNYQMLLFRIDTLAKRNIYQNAVSFMSAEKKFKPILKRICGKNELKKKNESLLFYLPVDWPVHLSNGQYVWKVIAADAKNHLREAREHYRVFQLIYRTPPIPTLPENNKKIYPLSYRTNKNSRTDWQYAGPVSPKELKEILGGRKTTPSAEKVIALHWKPGILGIGKMNFQVFMRETGTNQTFKKIYQGPDTTCTFAVPYSAHSRRFEWYVVSSFRKLERQSEHAYFTVMPLRLSPPEDFLSFNIDAPEQTWKTLAHTKQIILKTEERNEVILDRPLLPVLFFHPHSDTLNEYSRREFLASIDSIEAHLRINPDVLIHVKGYIDRKSDAVEGPEARQLSLNRAQKIRSLLLTQYPDLKYRIVVDTLSLKDIFQSRVAEKTQSTKDLALIEAENRRAVLEVQLRHSIEKSLGKAKDLNLDSAFTDKIKTILSANPDVIIMVAGRRISEIVKAMSELQNIIGKSKRIYPYLQTGLNQRNHLLVYLSAEKLLYKPMMPKIIKSKLGRSYFSVTIDSIHAPSPFWWKVYLVPRNEIANRYPGKNWIGVDSGYVATNYSSWHTQLKWKSSGPLKLKWRADNPYVLVVKLRLQLAGIENIFVRPIEFQSKKKTVQTYRMILMQHVFASALSESRFLEARVQDILQDILRLHSRQMANAYITGHACEIGKDDYNMKLSQERARHTYDVLNRQLNILIDLGESAVEAKQLKAAFRGHVIGFGFWIPYQFEPKLLAPGMKEPRSIVEKLNQYPLQRVRNRRTEIQLTVAY